jgi:cell division protein FtsB
MMKRLVVIVVILLCLFGFQQWRINLLEQTQIALQEKIAFLFKAYSGKDYGGRDFPEEFWSPQNKQANEKEFIHNG